MARRLRNGLTSLGISVVWDESMPAVDWQEYLENSIDSIAAVVVLWSPRSINSGSVRDEARLALESEKLVNVLFEIAKPRFPYDRINGLSIDGWTADTEHAGWSRIVSTLSSRLEIEGTVKAALGAQLREVADRKRELANLQKELTHCRHAFNLTRTEVGAAETQLATSEAQLKRLQEMATTKRVIAAAWSDRDEARSELVLCRKRMAEDQEAFEQTEDRVREASALLADFVVSIGGGRPDEEGAIEGGAADTPAKGTGRDLPKDGDGIRIPPPVKRALPLLETQENFEPSRSGPAAQDATAVRRSAPPMASLPPGNVLRLQDRGKWVAIGLAGACAAILLLYGLMSRSPTVAPDNDGHTVADSTPPTMRGSPPDRSPTTPEPRARPDARAHAHPELSTKPAASALTISQQLGWIIGSWVVGKEKNGCSVKLYIALSDDGKKLVFTGSGSTKADEQPYKLISGSSPAVETSTYRFESAGPEKILGLNLSDQSQVDLEKCAQ